MRRHLLKINKVILLLMICTLLFPSMALGYSYGDPNKEDIAEAYVFIKMKLDENPANWDTAYQQYLVHKKVLEIEFGSKVTAVLEANFAAKDRELLQDNYRGMLAMNLKRRFDSVKKELANYSQAKLLLAKAKGTYEVLSPYVKNKATDNSVREAFDKALEALGNPGLFGVGKKDMDEAQFKQQVDWIYGSVKPLFPFRSEEKQSLQDAKEAEETDSGNTQTKADSPKLTPNQDSQQDPQQADSGKAADQPSTKGEKSADGKEAAPNSSQTIDVEDGDSSADLSPGDSAKNVSDSATSGVETPEHGNSAEPNEPTGPVDTDSGTPDHEEVSDAESVSMNESDKGMDAAASRVNPLVSLSVIGSVVLAAGLIIAIAAKKGLFKS